MHKPSMLTCELDCNLLLDYELILLKCDIDFTNFVGEEVCKRKVSSDLFLELIVLAASFVILSIQTRGYRNVLGSTACIMQHFA
jgi:hypothetical protein